MEEQFPKILNSEEAALWVAIVKEAIVLGADEATAHADAVVEAYRARSPVALRSSSSHRLLDKSWRRLRGSPPDLT